MRTFKNAKDNRKRLAVPLTVAAFFAAIGVGATVNHGNVHADPTQGNAAQTAVHDTQANHILANQTLHSGLGAENNAGEDTNADNAGNNNNNEGGETDDDGDSNNNNPSNNVTTPNNTMANNNDHDYYAGPNYNDNHDNDDAALAAAIANSNNKRDETMEADTEASIKDNDMNAALSRQQVSNADQEHYQAGLTQQMNNNSAAESRDRIEDANLSNETSLKTSASFNSLTESFADSSVAASKATSAKNSVAASESQLQGAQGSNQAAIHSAATGAVDAINGANDLQDAERAQLLNQVGEAEDQLDNQVVGANNADQMAGLIAQANGRFQQIAATAQREQQADVGDQQNSAVAAIDDAVDNATNAIEGNHNLTSAQQNALIGRINSEAANGRTGVAGDSSAADMAQAANSLQGFANSIASNATSEGNANVSAAMSQSTSVVNSQRAEAINSVNANPNLYPTEKSAANSAINSAANSKLGSMSAHPSYTDNYMMAQSQEYSEVPSEDSSAIMPENDPDNPNNPANIDYELDHHPVLPEPLASDTHSAAPSYASAAVDSKMAANPTPQLDYGATSARHGLGAIDPSTPDNGTDAPEAANPFANIASSAVNDADGGEGGNTDGMSSLQSETTSMEAQNRADAQSTANSEIDSVANSLVGSANNEQDLTKVQRDSMASAIYNEENNDKAGIASAAFVPNIQSYAVQLDSFADAEASAATHDASSANRWFQNDPYDPSKQAPNGYHYNANGDVLPNTTTPGSGADKVINDEKNNVDDDGLGGGAMPTAFKNAYQKFAKIYGNNNPLTVYDAASEAFGPFAGFGPYAGFGDWSAAYQSDYAQFAKQYGYGNPYTAYLAAQKAFGPYANFGVNPVTGYYNGINPVTGYYNGVNPVTGLYSGVNPFNGVYGGYQLVTPASANRMLNDWNANTGYNVMDDLSNPNLVSPIYNYNSLNAYENVANWNKVNQLAASGELNANAIANLDGVDSVFPYADGFLPTTDGQIVPNFDYAPFVNKYTKANPWLNAPTKTKLATTYLSGFKPVVKGFYTPFGEGYRYDYKPVYKTAKHWVSNPYAVPYTYVKGYKPVVKGFYTPFGEQYRIGYQPELKTGHRWAIDPEDTPYAGHFSVKPEVKGVMTPFGEEYHLSYKPVMKTVHEWLGDPGVMPYSYVDGEPVVAGAYAGKGVVIPQSLIPFAPVASYYGIPYMLVNGVAYTESGNTIVPLADVLPVHRSTAGTAKRANVNVNNAGSDQAVNDQSTAGHQLSLPRTSEHNDAGTAMAYGLMLLALAVASAGLATKKRHA